MLRHNQGQSTLEYAILIAVVVAALLATQIYIKRGVQGKLRESTDQIGEQFDTGKTKVTSNRNRTATTVQELSQGVTNTYTGQTVGGQTKGEAEKVTESGSEEVGAW